MNTRPLNVVQVARRAGRSMVLAAVVVLAAAVATAGLAMVGLQRGSAPAHAQDPATTEPPPALVILARSDNPADALAAGPIGGVLGAPVLLTPRGSLHAATADALRSIDPDLVVLAGGTAALSEAVEAAVNQLGYPTRRAAGADRHETAVLVSALLAEWVTPQQRITALEGEVATLEGEVSGLEGEVTTLEEEVAALEVRVAAVEATLAGVTRATVEGRDTLTFTGMNVQVVNGTGVTDTDPNGLGNLIVGYNAQRPEAAERTGSHYLVVGDQHEWTAYGGIVAGVHNAAFGAGASVTGGIGNAAIGNVASVTGGFFNAAVGEGASVSGGYGNAAMGDRSSVSGGNSNAASGEEASVSGGSDNTASGDWSSILGGTGEDVGGTNVCHPACV